MKKKLLLICITTVMTASSHAQPGRGENPKFDPAFNPYEKVLDDTARGKRTARFLKYLSTPEVLRDYFYSSPCNDFAVLADTRISQFKALVEKFKSMPIDPKQMKIAEDNYKKYGLAKLNADLAYEIENLEKQGSYTGNSKEPVENILCRAKGNIQTLKNNLAYLEAVKEFFPSTPGLEEAIQTARDGISKYGNNKTILASIKSNKNEAIANVLMPKALTQNAEWEGWFSKWFAKEYPGYTLVKQSLLSANWYIKKNEISGHPEYRHIGTAIGAKDTEGRCWIIKVDLFQDYLGGKFDASRFKMAGKDEMVCENL